MARGHTDPAPTRHGEAPSKATLREAAEAWVAGAKDGSIRTRSGDRYKPWRCLVDAALRLYLLHGLGARSSPRSTARTCKTWVERLHATGCSPSTIRNALMPCERSTGGWRAGMCPSTRPRAWSYPPCVASVSDRHARAGGQAPRCTPTRGSGAVCDDAASLRRRVSRRSPMSHMRAWHIEVQAVPSRSQRQSRRPSLQVTR